MVNSPYIELTGTAKYVFPAWTTPNRKLIDELIRLSRIEERNKTQDDKDWQACIECEIHSRMKYCCDGPRGMYVPDKWYHKIWAKLGFCRSRSGSCQILLQVDSEIPRLSPTGLPDTYLVYQKRNG